MTVQNGHSALSVIGGDRTGEEKKVAHLDYQVKM
jgi:hypothetical protein